MHVLYKVLGFAGGSKHHPCRDELTVPQRRYEVDQMN